MTEVKQAAQEFQELDTTVVQVRSVLNFMYTLGYNLDVHSEKGRLVTFSAAHQGNRYLSFNTAVAMHNLREDEWMANPETGEAFPANVKLLVGFSVVAVRIAMASRLIKKAKVGTRKNGQLETKSFMIKPLNDAVLRLVEPA